MFILLVTPPGVGKSLLIDPLARIWRKVKGLHLAPDNMSKAAFLDVLQTSATHLQTPDGPMTYHALSAASSEFGNLCPQYDMEYLGVLTRVYDCGDEYKDFKRSRNENQINIINPHLNLVAGSQPDYLSQFLPDAAWGQGFMARIIMVYSDESMDFDMFAETPQKDDLRDDLIARATAVMSRVGNVPWTEEAKDFYRARQTEGFPPIPDHLKLKNYVTRRGFYVLKLALISAVSRGQDSIEASDISRGLTWLIDAEATMPEIFKAMKGNSDYSVLQELHLYVAQSFASNGGKAIGEPRLIRFLSERTVAWMIPKLMDAAEKSGLIRRVVGGNGVEMWKPGEGQLGPET